jgi:hypothetical protein
MIRVIVVGKVVILLKRIDSITGAVEELLLFDLLHLWM